MAYENKSTNHHYKSTTNRNSDEYYADNEDVEKESSPIKSLLIAGAIAGGGIVAYKTGLLKKGIKEMIKYADNYKAVLPTKISTYRKWILEKATKENADSLVRSKNIIDMTKKIFKSENGIEETINATLKDFKDLKNREKIAVTKTKLQHNNKIPREFTNTDLYYDINKIDRIANQYKSTAASSEARKIMTNDLLKNAIISDKKMESQLFKTGYRTATLGDLLKRVESKSGKDYLVNKVSNVALDSKTISKIDEFLSSNNLYKSSKIDWKKISLDKNILVDEEGKVADLRHVVDNATGFVRSISKDFGIPFIGLNPLGLLGLDKFGYKETKFAMLDKEMAQPVITGMEGFKTLSSFGDKFGTENMLFSNGNLYAYSNTEGFKKLRDDIKLIRLPNEKGGKIPKYARSLQKVANINPREYIKYGKNDTKFQRVRGAISDILDIGKQESNAMEYDNGLFMATLGKLDPNTYIEKTVGKALTHKGLWNKGYVERKGLTPFGGSPSDIDKYNTYVAIKKKIKFSEFINPDNDITIKNYFEQFLKGRKDLHNVNENSLKLYNLFERMNDALKPFGLALSPESLGSTQSVILNMILKRFLPIYMGYQGLQYINYLTEDKDGNNAQKDIEKAKANVSVGVHTLWGKLGLDKPFKKIKDLTPGSDNITELPIIKNLHPDKNGEEMKEYYKEGMEPVRKGRYWPIGNTAFTGGKVEYYKPIHFREVMADADFSENKYGSRKEYFANAWFPTPTAPFAPIRHFISDKYHYENKHYYDRPYLMTSPEFENIPIVGPILSGTIGQAVKPQRKMHLEYWQRNNNEQQKETNNPKNSEAYYVMTVGSNADKNVSIKNEGSFTMDTSKEKSDIGSINLVNPVLTKNQKLSLGSMVSGIGSPSNARVYTTASGNPSIINIDNKDLEKAKSELKQYSAKRIKNVKQRGSAISNENNEQNNSVMYTSDLNKNSFKNTFINQYQNAAEVTGLYGYLGKTYILGDLGNNAPQIETSGRAYSFNDKFWEQEYGGLGGEMSEIFRRFVQKEQRNTNKINPVANNQPGWMPSNDYFIDFKHGDPYQKITNGEFRLQGTPYEKLWNIKNPLDFGIGASSIGKSKSDLVKHFLHLDTPDNDQINDILNKGTSTHNKIEKQWLDSGFAIDVEQPVKDDINNIKGIYDARIHDKTAPGGEALVDIKTINQKGFDEVVKTGQGKDVNVRQLNFYLGQLGMKKGYLHYVNRDTNQRYTVTVKFDKDLLQDTINNVNAARDEVRGMLERNEISRGDLYAPIDRYRILADVAPYSEEFKNMETILSRSNMSDEEKEEVRKIKEHMQGMKQPQRIYNYKFKTAKLRTIKTEVTKTDGQSVYVNFNGEERKINFAGITAGDIKRTQAVKDQIDFVKRHLKKGKTVTLKVDDDETQWNKTKGIKAIVYDNRGVNINKQLVMQNLYEFNDDDSPTAVNVRYGKIDRLFGSTWERIAHADTYFNTKFLHVRSATEDYERTEVYGKSFQTWQHPIRDYLMPSIYHNIGRKGGLLVGTLSGAVLGGMFGRNKFGASIGAVIGGSTVLIGKMYAGAYEIKNGKKWVPKVRRKERETEEYMDVLKYVKNMRLYEYYKNRSLKEEHFDVDKYLRTQKENSDKRKKEENKLNNTKALRKRAYKKAKDERDEFDAESPYKINYGNIDGKLKKAVVKKINEHFKNSYDKKLGKLKSKAREKRKDVTKVNKEINELSSYRSISTLPPLAAKAIEYKQLAEKTMYGYDPGEPLTNLLSALPKKDRDRMKYFLNAPKAERKRLLEIVPEYVKRPLQAAYGMKVDKKPTLTEYFKNHQLPDENWAGWREDTDLNSIKVKMIQKEGLDQSEFNEWEDDFNKANQAPKIPIPKMNYRANAGTIRNRLHKLLGDMNVQNVNVTYNYNNTGKMNINMDLKYNKQKYINDQIDNADFSTDN